MRRKSKLIFPKIKKRYRFIVPKVSFSSIIIVALLIGTATIFSCVYAEIRFQGLIETAANRLNKKIRVVNQRFGIGSLKISEIIVGDQKDKDYLSIEDISVSLSLNPLSKNFLNISKATIHNLSGKFKKDSLLESLDNLAPKANLNTKNVSNFKLSTRLPNRVEIKNATIELNDHQAHLSNLLVSPNKRGLSLESGRLKLSGNKIQVTDLKFGKSKNSYQYKALVTSSDGMIIDSIGKINLDFSVLTGKFNASKFPQKLTEALKKRGIILSQTSFSTNLTMSRLKNSVKFAATPQFQNLVISHARLAPVPIGPMPASLKIIGIVNNDNKFIIRNSSIKVFSWPLSKSSNMVELKLNARGSTDFENLSVLASINNTKCSDLLSAIPLSLAPTLREARFEGNVSGKIRFKKNLNIGSSIKIINPVFDCKPKSTLAHISRNAFFDKSPIDFAENVSPKFFLSNRNNYSFTKLENISKPFIKMVIQSEDGSFYKHKGIVWKQIEAALNKNFENNEVSFGGSTISMQLAKNLYLSPERTVSRKIQEVFITKILEHELTKDEILETYLNVIEFGPGIFGANQASMHFFGTPVKKLPLVEASYLSSVIPAPTPRYINYCERRLGKSMRALMKSKIKRLRHIGAINFRSMQSAFKTPISFTTPTGMESAICLNIAKKSSGGLTKKSL